MDVLMIGGTGVLSSAVTAECIKRGIQVTMINRGHGHIPNGVRLIKSDRDNLKYIASQLKGHTFDAVIDYLCYSDQETTRSFNFYKDYTNQYFFISSCAVYDTRVGGIMREDSPKVLPMWSYSVEKWASEQHLQKLAEGAGIKYTIIRPCVTYGNTRIPYGISPQYGYHYTLCARALAGKPIIRWNKGVNRCNMTRVEDFAVGVVGLIGNPKAFNEAFNVCGENAPSFNDVLDAMGEVLGIKIPIIDISKEFYADEIPYRRGELLGGRCIDAINSNEKIKDTVPEFKQTISLKDGIRKTIEAYKRDNYEKGIDWHFDAETDRIIRKWCRKQGISRKPYNLHFVDYLGTATPQDRKYYYFESHRDDLSVRIYRRLSGLAHRVIGKLKQ